MLNFWGVGSSWNASVLWRCYPFWGGLYEKPRHNNQVCSTNTRFTFTDILFIKWHVFHHVYIKRHYMKPTQPMHHYRGNPLKITIILHLVGGLGIGWFPQNGVPLHPMASFLKLGQLFRRKKKAKHPTTSPSISSHTNWYISNSFHPQKENILDIT